MTARRGRYAKRSTKPGKAYMFDEKILSKILRSLAHFRRARDFNGVSEGKTLRIMPTFMKAGPASSLIVQTPSHKDVGTTHRLPKTGKKEISTNAETVFFLLETHATNPEFANATLNIAWLENNSTKTLVQLADALQSKFVCCGNAYKKECSKAVLINSLPASI